MGQTDYDPFAAIGGGVQLWNGGWLPKTMFKSWSDTQGGGGSSGQSQWAAGWSTNWMPTPAPKFTAPQLGPETPWSGPAAFTYQPFTLPNGQQVLQQDPGYQFRLQQGQDALQRSAAARGMITSGAAQQALQEHAQNVASQEYANAFNRALQQYRTNYDVARDVYGLGMQRANEAYARDLAERMRQYEIERQRRQDEYEPDLLTWKAQQLAAGRNAELLFNRTWDREQFERNLAEQQRQFDLSRALRERGMTLDDAFRWEQLREQRRQFLTNLGLM